MAAVVTANFGSYDRPRAPKPQDTECEWICFTDDPALEAPGWRVLMVRPRYEHPNMAAKVFKMESWARTVWIDANIEVTSSSFVREALASARDGLALYQHPRRDCIYAEAEASLGNESQGGRYDELPIADQVASYRAEGHPAHGGLYACGIIAWEGSDIGEAWLRECERWGYQDQISFPVVCRRAGIRPGLFDHPQIERRRRGWLENRWLRIHPHL